MVRGSVGVVGRTSGNVTRGEARIWMVRGLARRICAGRHRRSKPARRLVAKVPPIRVYPEQHTTNNSLSVGANAPNYGFSNRVGLLLLPRVDAVQCLLQPVDQHTLVPLLAEFLSQFLLDVAKYRLELLHSKGSNRLSNLLV
jgi:hypothetical protein